MKMAARYNLSELRHFRRLAGVRHPQFGDLNRLRSVEMLRQPHSHPAYSERRPYYVHLSVTGRCNARCEGCINSCVTSREDHPHLSVDLETQPERDARAILELLREEQETDVAVCFYGGEPLLVVDKMAEIADVLDGQCSGRRFHYMVYTNGMLLDRAIAVRPQFMSKVWLYAVSIDGTESQHNAARLGTDLQQIEENLDALQKVRSGKVILWSTLREKQSLMDCCAEFISLHGRGLVDQFFWHWVETDTPFDVLSDYVHKYQDELDRVMRFYLSWLEDGRILPIVHINELVLYLLTGKRRGCSACGVEEARNFDIIGGKVHSCADLPSEFAIGEIDEDGIPHVREIELAHLVDYKQDLGCYDCGVHAYCGGRCPVQALTSQAHRLVQYCQLMRVHVGVVQNYVRDIEKQLDRKKISLQQLYDRSAFYAQFTDVTP